MATSNRKHLQILEVYRQRVPASCVAGRGRAAEVARPSRNVWRWRLWASNGNNTANAGQSYDKPSGSLKSAVAVLGLNPDDFAPAPLDPRAKPGSNFVYHVRRHRAV